MVYPPSVPYVSDRGRTFNADIEQDRIDAKDIYCSHQQWKCKRCDFTLKVTQGGVDTNYLIRACGEDVWLETLALNLLASNGEVTYMELLHTPDAQDVWPQDSRDVVATWPPTTEDMCTIKLMSGFRPIPPNCTEL